MVCGICAEEKRLGEFAQVTLCGVGHWGGSYCRECLYAYISIKIKESYSETVIKCLVPGCKSEISEMVINQILNETFEGKKLLEKYKQLKEQSMHKAQVFLLKKL